VTKDPHAWRLRSNATHGLLEDDGAAAVTTRPRRCTRPSP
jgi:hypothetical protein